MVGKKGGGKTKTKGKGKGKGSGHGMSGAAVVGGTTRTSYWSTASAGVVVREGSHSL